MITHPPSFFNSATEFYYLQCYLQHATCNTTCNIDIIRFNVYITFYNRIEPYKGGKNVISREAAKHMD